MSTIQVLPDELINKIAAGEVIERPASVVKELVENALDAGASIVTVKLKNGGMDEIIIQDNGSGIDDVETAILRHATSKLHKETDLFEIMTLGFRGEALASICAIAKVRIKTKLSSQTVGTEFIIEKGKIIEKKQTACETGTIIYVNDLFYNTPARKKFLKTKDVERRHCQEVATRLALSYPQTSVQLFHEDKELVAIPSHSDIRQKITAIIEPSVVKDMIALDYQTELFTVKGLISSPYHVRNDKDKQFVLINNRVVKSQAVEQAILEAYHSMLFLDKQPYFIIFIELDARMTDVNVHPTKQIIRIDHEAELKQAIITACKRGFEKSKLIPEVEISNKHDFKTPFHASSAQIVQKQKEKQILLEKNIDTNSNVISAVESANFEFKKNNIETNLHLSENKNMGYGNSILNTAENNSTDIISNDNLVDDATRKKEQTLSNLSSQLIAESNESVFPLNEEKKHDFGIIKILGQIHNLYILAQGVQGLVLIDQHAAEERVLYETFMQQYKEKKIPSQELLTSLLIDLSHEQMELYLEYQQVFKKIGFVIDEFGDTEVQISAVPELLGVISKNHFLELLKECQLLTKQEVQTSVEEKIIMRSCKSAIKAGDELTIPQMHSLIEKMKYCQMPFTCPHGRPTMIAISYEELEKKFKRRV